MDTGRLDAPFTIDDVRNEYQQDGLDGRPIKEQNHARRDDVYSPNIIVEIIQPGAEQV